MAKRKQQSTKLIEQLATLMANSDNQGKNIEEIKIDIKDLKGNFVTMDRYTPVERIVYGLVAIVLLTVAGSILEFIIVMKH